MHWREVVKVGDYTVLASSYDSLVIGKHDVAEQPLPDFGMYLADDWNSVKTSYPKRVIAWPDRGIIKLEELKQIVTDIVLMLESGKNVEIACFAGEGRTGVVLACLVGQLEGLKSEAAIRAIRERYCVAAVDTTKQEKLVESYLDTAI
jgi:hypothetical protein